MSRLEVTPRVTLGVATSGRATHLAEALNSGLAQDYRDLEVLVVVDGPDSRAIDTVLAGFADESRLRVIRHERERGIAAAYDTFISEGRGELIAMIGDDGLCLPGRLRRQVEVFDRYPETGVVHGDAIVIDAHGSQTDVCNSADFTPMALVRSFYRDRDRIVDPTRMVHRRVYETVGGYTDRHPIAFDFSLRAARRFRFRHVAGGPLCAVRARRETDADGRTGGTAEISAVEAALEAALERYSLRELVPELDWAVLDPQDAERQALLRLAAQLDARALPLPRLATKVRRRAEAMPARPPAVTASGRLPRRSSHGRVMITSFGFNDSGGGTTVPRLVSKELARRGWDVIVFHAAVGLTPTRTPYELVESVQDGVRLIGVHNRPHGLFDIGNPWRELDDPSISAAFAATLDRFTPDVVHFYNLHNLGASLMDHATARGIPAHFTPNNYWLVCPRAYLMDGQGSICAGPADGARCASCVGSHDVAGHQRRLAGIRSRAHRSLRSIQAVSGSVRDTLLAAGYDPDLVDVVRQAMPEETEVWNRVGREREPGRTGEELTVAFLGSAYPHKGPQLLIEAAQRTEARLRVLIHGEVPERFARKLVELDRRGVVELSGKFAPSEISDLLRDVDVAALPSMWWDCAPLAAFECKAARVPLVVPRLGGLVESVRDGIDGLLFEALDAADLARALDRFALEPGLLERMQGAIEAPPPFSAYVDELEAYYAGERPGRVHGHPTAQDVCVRWQGDHGLSTSLSIINDRVTERLPGRVQRLARDGAASLDPPLPHAAHVEVRHQWPPDLRPPAAGRLAVIQPWEFGAVPRAWLAGIDACVDELWVPSDHVRRMYLSAGVDPERVVTIPNGVDLDVFTPEGEPLELPGEARPEGIRYLFVGGLIWRKGADVLLKAWKDAFAGRDDVTLVIKDFGRDGVYRQADRGPIDEHAESGRLPRIVLVPDELETTQMAALYRSCHVLVHPYRGEGFAMPVLEAMACGLPVIVTAGGPTDEFCPPEAGWRIHSSRVQFPSDRVDSLETAGRPWVLEPDAAHLAGLLRLSEQSRADRLRRGIAGRSAARALSWDAVAARYAERLAGLALRPSLLASPERAGADFELTEDAALRILATPAWRADDRLGELLAEWSSATTPASSACLYLLADPSVDGDPAELEGRVYAAAAAAGAEIDAGADINVLMEPLTANTDASLHAAVNAYVPLHGACAGHERLARSAGNEVIALGGGRLAQLSASAPLRPSQAFKPDGLHPITQETR